MTYFDRLDALKRYCLTVIDAILEKALYVQNTYFSTTKSRPDDAIATVGQVECPC